MFPARITTHFLSPINVAKHFHRTFKLIAMSSLLYATLPIETAESCWTGSLIHSELMTFPTLDMSTMDAVDEPSDDIIDAISAALSDSGNDSRSELSSPG
jgi:hypothetical protein